MFRIITGCQAATPLGVEIRGICWNLSKGIGYLVIKPDLFHVTLVLNRNASPFSERHWPIAVKSTIGINGYHYRIHVISQTMAVSEKIPERTFDRRRVFVIPVKTDDSRPVEIRMDSQPDMLYNAGTFNVSQCGYRAGRQV